MNFDELDQVKFGRRSSTKRCCWYYILLDVTGSMGPAIVELGKNMINFVNSIDKNLVSDFKVKIHLEILKQIVKILSLI